jgi:hypothetical protein
VPVGSSTVFEIGSISKQITAAAVMMLVEEGKVSLNDPISKYIGESPGAWRGVTVRHLLTHTSGLKNYNGLTGFELREHLSRAEFVKRIGAYPPSFAPGEAHSYGNINYSLLGYVIEQVSGPSKPTGTGDMPFVKERVAIEALRAGVPNRAAIQLLGTDERALCDRFVERLRQCKADAEMVEGEIIAGGFGSGKSHHLGILAEEALRENFIVSKVAISKETPLFDPDRLFASAIRNAIVPSVNDDAMTAVLARLKPNASDDLEKWTTKKQWPQFAALMFLLPKQVITTEDVATIAKFFGGSRLNAAKIKQWLRAAGAARLFDIKPVKAAQLAIQRIEFAPRLFRAAGFSGWCILIDEAELIGRYSALQRGKSYAEICRWLGLAPQVAVPGIVGLWAKAAAELAELNPRDRIPTISICRRRRSKSPKRGARSECLLWSKSGTSSR